MNSTFELRRPARSAEQSSLADLLARAILKVQSFGRAPVPTQSEASAQLLRLAEAYESTQPSYAADLRAAAGREIH